MFETLNGWREAGLEHSNRIESSDFENGLETTMSTGLDPDQRNYGYEKHVERLRIVDTGMVEFNLSHLDFVDCLIDADEQGVWVSDGSPSLTEWLTARYRMNRLTASDLARIVEKLPGLPNIRRVFEEGRLSWDQLRAVVAVATPETDLELSETAPELTPAEIKATLRTVTEKDVVEANRDREVRYWFHEKDPLLEMRVLLPDTEGAAFITALTRKASQLDLDTDTGGVFDHAARLADALIQMGSQSLAADADHDRATLLVHTEIPTLLGSDDATQAYVGDGTIVPPGTTITNQTLRRLACDARIQLVIEDPADGVIGIGRTDRTIPPWLARVCRSRDKGCRFPGCERTVWLHHHHIIHWADGGPTLLTNLITLCGYHHRLIHNDGWTIQGNPNNQITWITKWGTEFQRHPEWPGIESIKQHHANPLPIEAPRRRASGSIDYTIHLERTA
jgi:hypothetical protein